MGKEASYPSWLWRFTKSTNALVNAGNAGNAKKTAPHLAKNGGDFVFRGVA